LTRNPAATDSVLLRRFLPPRDYHRDSFQGIAMNSSGGPQKSAAAACGIRQGAGASERLKWPGKFKHL